MLSGSCFLLTLSVLHTAFIHSVAIALTLTCAGAEEGYSGHNYTFINVP